jgi:ABC-type oligopeptide transport system substrate-binding subunit
MTARRLSHSLAMVVAGTALLGASALESSASEAPKGGTLRIMSPDDLRVDPALAYTTDMWLIEYATCAKLFNHPDEAGEAGTRVAPEVVRSHTVSRDGRVYTFDLRQSFRFHTGAAVTARSFADAFHRNVQPKLGSPAADYMREIVGARAVVDGRAESISGVRVLDRFRLEIRLTKPAGDFIARLAMPFFCPIRPGTPVDPKGISNPAGSGPYYVAEHIVNQRTVLRRNPFYRGNRPANVDQVVWTTGVTVEECQRAVEEDRADFCGEPGAPRGAYPALAGRYGINRPGGQLFVRPRPATWFLVFNNERPSFRGPGQIPLKKAINYAIDRPALTRAFGFLAGKRTAQMLPPVLARRANVYPLGGADAVTARRWYQRARLKPTTLVLYAWAIPPAVEAAEVLRFNLKQLGIELDVRFLEPFTVIEKARIPGEPVDLVMNAWAADYTDGATFFVPLLARGGSANVGNVDDPAIDRRIAATNRLAGEARRRAWSDLDADLMRDDPPWAPFMHLNMRTLVSRSLGCFVDHPLYRVDIAAVCKKR